MATYRLHPLDKTDVEPFPISERLRSQLHYFAGPPDHPAAPPDLKPGEYWFHIPELESYLEQGAFSVISPLDLANATEIELSEEQEALLQWLVTHEIRHTRLERAPG
ncbi:MAG: hypothetical protein D6736_13800 [Nitrospinota bacterium]|nr:MAG: hypothetical protein D6736_13800 [Nitrospinota bacterium]